MRELQARTSERLTEIGALLKQAGPQTWIADGYKYRAATQTRKSFSLDEAKLRVVEPAVYQRCITQTVDGSKVKAEIASGTAKHWSRYAKYTEGQPYVVITREEAE